MGERCETCGGAATHWDYDQMMYFCARDVQQPKFTVPMVDTRSKERLGWRYWPTVYWYAFVRWVRGMFDDGGRDG